MENLFKFNAKQLDEPRLPGISAIMRIKNGEDFLRESIESHIDHVDEIIACHNDCSDQSVKILEELSEKYTNKIKIIEYLPKVHPILSMDHATTPTNSINSIANYYNFALSKASYNYAFKLDDDHLAINSNLHLAVQEVRKSIAKTERKLFTFSGLNIAPSKKGNLEIFTPEMFVGSGDHLFFPVCSDIHFIQELRTEIFKFPIKSIPKIYVGLLYFHLKYCKPSAGFLNLDSKTQIEILKNHKENFSTINFPTMKNMDHIKKLIKKINPIEYFILTNYFSRSLIFKLTGKNPPIKVARLWRLHQDLGNVDFENDVIEKLKNNKAIISVYQLRNCE